MKRDAFCTYHPAVNFLFFIGALGFGVVILHPAFLLTGIIGALCYYLLLVGQKGLRRIAMMIPIFLLVTFINPLINRTGATPLFTVCGIPYSFESLIYGAVLSGMFLTMILWFQCYSSVMTGDKFTSLFGNLFPSLSLLLVMVFRMVPNLIRKGHQIIFARKSIGKGMNEKKMEESATVLSCLTTWALEGSIITADSMRSRGYGTAKRTGFQIYRMESRDCILLGIMLLLASGLIAAMALGHTDAAFTPDWVIAPLSPIPLTLYFLYTMIPTFLHLQEALSWHILRSRI